MDLKLTESKVWGVPNQEEYGSLHGVMHDILGLLAFPCNKDTKSTLAAERSQSTRDSIKMCIVRKNSWLYGRFQRKLINESLDTFLSLQRAANNQDKYLKSIIAKKSKEYRSMIQACISEMSSFISNFENGKEAPFQEDVSQLKINCQLLYKMELVLGLIEIIFIELQPGGCVLNHLLNWIRLHFPRCRQQLSEALSSDQPASYPYFWETCYGLVMQGLLEEARGLLNRHPDSNSDSFLSMDELLRKMPVYSAYSGISEPEFNVRWHHWQSECEARLQKGDFVASKQLQTICKIICGDLETLLSLVDVLDTWYHFMVTHLLFSNPLVKLHRLPSTAQESILAFVGENQMSYLDHLLVAVIEVNDHLVMKHCHSVLDNLWFTAHLGDLLYHSVEKQEEKSYLKHIRESLLIDYGSELVSHKSLWQIGLVYLDTCGPASSIPIAEAVIERIPLDNDIKTFKLVQASTERSFDSVAMSICRVMGRKMLREGHLGAAIWWGIRSQDVAFTSHLAHKILYKYVEEGEFSSTSLLDHLGPSVLLSDTLTFLSKYREFHLLYQESNLKEAASLLVSLIASRLAPEYFWPVLLEDALPLLQSPNPVITVDQTYKLMYCLHNLSINAEDSSLTKEKKEKMYASFLSKESDIRLALTNNLARAIISEGTQEY
ncbi:UNVERIFIED_CONTAM: hypothetical protein RMT77_013699 [Armadillidium vulgare]